VGQERRHAPTEPENLKFPNEAISKARGGGSRQAIVDTAQRLFLEHGFGAVSMEDPAVVAGVALQSVRLPRIGGHQPAERPNSIELTTTHRNLPVLIRPSEMTRAN
jgi:hypothetical protein